PHSQQQRADHGPPAPAWPGRGRPRPRGPRPRLPPAGTTPATARRPARAPTPGVTMPVTDISRDLDSLTLTITSRFAAPVERIWQIYADPRQLEKVWGPREYPATVVDHDLTPGGRVTYHMTGAEGDRHYAQWSVPGV